MARGALTRGALTPPSALPGGLLLGFVHTVLAESPMPRAPAHKPSSGAREAR